MSPRFIALPAIVAVFVAAVALALASGNGTQSAASTRPGAVTITNFKFLPRGATVAAGTRVSFLNKDSAPHTATADGGAFDSGAITTGQTKTITLARVGTYAYHCAFHPFMHATITVR